MPRPKTTLDPRVRSLLERFLKAAQIVQKDYAVGGALAMAAHGYVRETQDVDAFLRHEDRILWFRALRQLGLDIEPVFTGVHYIATDPKYRTTKIRIDLLLPAEDPELSAVEVPDIGQVEKFQLNVFPLELLVISKFLSTRPEDHHDVDAMYSRGLFVPAQVATILERVRSDTVSRFLERYP